jgi:hypothetical protein
MTNTHAHTHRHTQTHTDTHRDLPPGDENNTLDDEEFRQGRDWFEIVHEHVIK